MNITVLYFGAVRERANGLREEALTLHEGASVADVRDAAVERHPSIAPLLPSLRLARNERFVKSLHEVLNERDVVAFITPVAGGSGEVALQHGPIDVRAVEAQVTSRDRGGLVTFTGLVRDHTGEHAVERLEYEAYDSMAIRVLQEIVDETKARFSGVRVAVAHRLGVLGIGEVAVCIAVSAPHRAESFEACRFVIERLKEDVPIFKREVRTDGSVWVGLGS